MHIRSRQILQTLILGVLLAFVLIRPALPQEREGYRGGRCPLGISFGVLNGRAVEMPAPVYPQEAKDKDIAGVVAVFVVVDKRGRVTEARACSGPRELRGAAEDAALKARLRPTLLSGVAVGNRGVLTYAFPPKEKSRDAEPAADSSTQPPGGPQAFT